MRVIGSVFNSPIVLIVMLIVVLVALLVVWAMVANSCRKQENDIIPTNTAAIVADDEPTDEETTPLIPSLEDEVDPNYGPFELALEPVEGTAPWTEVTVDGESVFVQALSERQTWQVTADCVVTTAQPGNLIVTRNGEAVSLETDGNGFGSVELEVIQKPEAGQEQTNSQEMTEQTNSQETTGQTD